MFKKEMGIKEILRIIRDTKFSEIKKEFDENFLKTFEIQGDEGGNSKNIFLKLTNPFEKESIHNISYVVFETTKGKVKKRTIKKIAFRVNNDTCEILDITLANRFKVVELEGEDAMIYKLYGLHVYGDGIKTKLKYTI